MKLVKEIKDCDGFVHTHIIHDEGFNVILISKNGFIVSKSAMSEQEAKAYMTILSEIMADVSKKEREVKVTKKTLPVNEKPLPEFPIKEQVLTPQLSLFTAPKRKKEEEVIIHTPRPKKVGENIDKHLHHFKIILNEVRQYVPMMEKMIEEIEEELKERNN